MVYRYRSMTKKPIVQRTWPKMSTKERQAALGQMKMIWGHDDLWDSFNHYIDDTGQVWHMKKGMENFFGLGRSAAGVTDKQTIIDLGEQKTNHD